MTGKIFKNLCLASTIFHRKKKKNNKITSLTFFILEQDYFLLICNPLSVAQFVNYLVSLLFSSFFPPFHSTPGKYYFITDEEKNK